MGAPDECLQDRSSRYDDVEACLLRDVNSAKCVAVDVDGDRAVHFAAKIKYVASVDGIGGFAVPTSGDSYCTACFRTILVDTFPVNRVCIRSCTLTQNRQQTNSYGK